MLYVLTAAGVALAASGAALVAGPAGQQTRGSHGTTDTTQAVAAVWRAGATAALAADSDSRQQGQQGDVVAAELLADRDGSGASRSDDRLADQPAADGTGATDSSTDVAEAPAEAATDTQTPSSDPVEQARQDVLRLARQQVADDDDAAVATEASTVPVSSARDAVDAADEQRAAEALAVALEQAQSDPRPLAQAMAAERGWAGQQFVCLDKLWTKESGWSWSADNPTSTAYGIPQALPGSRMAANGADWQSNPATQIAWGLDYIADRYGMPCSAWSHSVARNWY